MIEAIAVVSLMALVLTVVVVVLIASSITRSIAARSSNPGPLRPMYYQARERTQAELLAQVPASLRQRGLNLGVYMPNFSGQRQWTHLELFPSELYEYVQRWNEGELIQEYVTQNGYRTGGEA